MSKVFCVIGTVLVVLTFTFGIAAAWTTGTLQEHLANTALILICAALASFAGGFLTSENF